MSILLNTARLITNEKGVITGMSAEFYKIAEFHHYPLNNTSSCLVLGYENQDGFSLRGDMSYCEKITFDFNDNPPVSISECEQRIILMENWEGTII